MSDIGVSCAKDSYYRGSGEVQSCPAHLESEAGLCYTPCEQDADGKGPVCWRSCPEGTTACGALCLAEGESCSAYLMDTFKGVFKGITALAKSFSNQPETTSDSSFGDKFKSIDYQELKDVAQAQMQYPKCHEVAPAN